MIPPASEPRSPPGFAVHGFDMRGVVSCLPRRQVSNDALVVQLGAKAVADITAMTGVKNRFWVDNTQTTADLCRAATIHLLTRLGWPLTSIDALVFVSQTPDQRLPATACILHGQLGLSPYCQAFDVSLGCSGYIYGLWLCATMIAAGCRRVLLLAGDTSSRLIDQADRSTALLFGDAGSATALEFRNDAPVSHFVLGTDGRGAPHLEVRSGGYRDLAADKLADTVAMNGSEVFDFTMRAVPALVRDTLALAGREIEEVDAFVLHQANRFMLRHIAKKLAIGADQMPINIERFGNTSSASIPLLLSTDLADSMTTSRTAALLAGFGVGFSWGAASLTLSPLICAETVSL